VTWGDHPQGIAIAKDILASGAAWQTLEHLVKFLKD
jgi:anthranilate phosphoribosyltransferase